MNLIDDIKAGKLFAGFGVGVSSGGICAKTPRELHSDERLLAACSMAAALDDLATCHYSDSYGACARDKATLAHVKSQIVERLGATSLDEITELAFQATTHAKPY